MPSNGGYKIISLGNNDFTIGGSAITIPGIYERIENNNRKPLLLSDVIISGIECVDRFVVFGINGSNYVAILSLSANFDVLKVTVTADDEVTITENE